MPALVHPTAVVGPDVSLGDGCTVGPFSVLDGRVTLGPGVVVGPHCHLIGELTVGAGSRFHAGCVVGDTPQHLRYKGEPTRTAIGARTVLREHVTVHRGMPTAAPPGTGETRIGDDCFLMAGSHVAHDCRVGDGVVLANAALLGGHVTVGDRAFLSGNTAVHQNCRVGRLAMLGGTSAITQDLPPFWIAQGGINRARGVNAVGMRRAGLGRDEIMAVRQAYRSINLSGRTIPDALAELEAVSGHLPAVAELLAFFRSTKRGVVTARMVGDEAKDDE
jgi:UDP-N-acetylglucosamine acyltransferase